MVGDDEKALRLMGAYGSFSALVKATEKELAGHGLSKRQARAVVAAGEMSRRLLEENAGRVAFVRSPTDVVVLLAGKVHGAEQERFFVVLLDTRHRVMAVRTITEGLLDSTLVHPREVFSEAIRQRAAEVVVAHNHPSGDTSPSAEDLRVTRQLIEAGKVLDIRVTDHVIMTDSRMVREGTGPGYLSMRENGLLDFGG
jgi:DNA repair protein RadC